MIIVTKINEITNSDAFGAFSWVGEPLKKLNLIYGWNGSGKTTISRVCSFLERRAVYPRDLESVDFVQNRVQC